MWKSWKLPAECSNIASEIKLYDTALRFSRREGHKQKLGSAPNASRDSVNLCSIRSWLEQASFMSVYSLELSRASF